MMVEGRGQASGEDTHVSGGVFILTDPELEAFQLTFNLNSTYSFCERGC